MRQFRKTILQLSLLVCFILVLVPKSFAETDVGNHKDIETLKAFIDSGIDYIKQYGAKKAYAEFSNSHGKFRQGDYYLYVYNYDGVCLAHGVHSEEKVGKNLYEGKDKYGTPYVKLMIELAKAGGGFINYYARQPDTQAIGIKTAYVKPIDDHTFIGGGIYKFIEMPTSYDVKVAELQAFVNTGVEYIKEHGEVEAFKEFNDPEGKFREGKLYFFVLDYKGMVFAEGADPEKYVGKNIYNLKDEYGTPFIRMCIETAKSGGGLVGYYWPEPATGIIQFKINYLKPLGNNKLIGAGFFEE